jgi:hypothetical protein
VDFWFEIKPSGNPSPSVEKSRGEQKELSLSVNGNP